MGQLTVREICQKHSIDYDIIRKRVEKTGTPILGRRKCTATARLSKVYDEDAVLKAWETRIIRGSYSTVLDDGDEYPLEIYKHNFRQETHQRDAQLVVRGMSCYTC